jgi:hypothetical protein
MRLYHFTSAAHLRGIGQYGLTVGDIPTNLYFNQGKVGVWLTSSQYGNGHGLERSAVDKKRFRLSVEVKEDDPCLHHWETWASTHVLRETAAALHRAGSSYRTWYVYLGVIALPSIVACTDMHSRREVTDWAEFCPPDRSLPAVAPADREAWHQRMLCNVARTLRNRRHVMPVLA